MSAETNRFDEPLLYFVVAFLAFWLSALVGALIRRRRGALGASNEKDVEVVLGAALTLMALIIGFSFSMAVSRYDQRKTFEEEEANAIGTAYVRAGLLPTSEATAARDLLRRYVGERASFYSTTDEAKLAGIEAATSDLQRHLWSVVQTAAAERPTPITALAVAGVNDVLNAQGYTQAAWWNRIPLAAWALMAVIGIFTNVLFGYAVRRDKVHAYHFLPLPVILAVALLLIADLDTPRAGLIRVGSQNLLSTGASFEP